MPMPAFPFESSNTYTYEVENSDPVLVTDLLHAFAFRDWPACERLYFEPDNYAVSLHRDREALADFIKLYRDPDATVPHNTLIVSTHRAHTRIHANVFAGSAAHQMLKDFEETALASTLYYLDHAREWWPHFVWRIYRGGIAVLRNKHVEVESFCPISGIQPHFMPGDCFKIDIFKNSVNIIPSGESDETTEMFDAFFADDGCTCGSCSADEEDEDTSG